MRAFIAINIPDDIKEEIMKLQNKIPDKFVKKVEKRNLHITLKFLGEIDEEMLRKVSKELEEVIKDKNNGYSPFRIVVSGVGFFPNENFVRVVWVGCKGESRSRGGKDELCRLNVDVDKALTKLGFSSEHRDLKPHLTIARVKRRINIKNLREGFGDKEFGSFIVNSIIIYESKLTPKGPIYTEKERLMFGFDT